MPERLRVLFVIGGLDRGGSETQIVNVVTGAHPDALDAVVVTLTEEGDEHRRRLRACGVPVESLAPTTLRRRYWAVRAWRFWRAVRRVRPDVIYAWLDESALLAAPVARLTRTPLVVARRNVHGAAIEERSGLARRAVGAAERSATIVTANSNAARDFAISRGVRAERVRVIYNGHADGHAEGFPPDDPVVFGYLARMREEKGHRRLLDVAWRLAEIDDRPWRLLLGGTGPLEDEIRARVAELGLAERVEFSGLISDVPAFWRRCHVAVLVSDHEGQPNVLIEAAVAGRCAVATDVGGTSEVVAPAGGVLCALDDIAGLALALARYVEAPERARAEGLAARAQARARFALAPSVQAHVAVLRSVLR